jgi:hypothetical protein
VADGRILRDRQLCGFYVRMVHGKPSNHTSDQHC